MTRLQKAILEIVQGSDKHLSAKDVYAMVQIEFPSVAMGTVYRNLNQFAEKNLIRRLSGLASVDYYEGNIKAHNHSLCVSCGRLTDVHIPGMKEFIESQIGSEAVSVDLLVNIVCSECVNKDNK